MSDPSSKTPAAGAETIEAGLARLSRLHPKKIDLSLGRIERLLAALGDPHLDLPPVIHLAGTNGKGSTAAFLKAIFEAAGERVHVYTSPHLVRFNERIVLAGEIVDDARLKDAFARCEAANGEAEITFFEITTAAAFLLFSETPADRVILETGLGGRVFWISWEKWARSTCRARCRRSSTWLRSGNWNGRCAKEGSAA